jgi:hypothetical protein
MDNGAVVNQPDVRTSPGGGEGGRCSIDRHRVALRASVCVWVCGGGVARAVAGIADFRVGKCACAGQFPYVSAFFLRGIWECV